MKVVSLVCDDGSPRDWTYREHFRSRGIAPTIPVVSSYFSGVINLNQFLTLQNEYGYEIASHTVTHARLTSLPQEDLEYQLRESKEQLKNYGFRCENFFVPYGDYNQNVLDTAMRYYRSARTSDKALNVKPFSLSNLKGYWLDGGDSLATMKGWVDAAAAVDDSWLILSFHTTTASAAFMTDTFGAVADYAIEKGLTPKTVSRALTEYGYGGQDTGIYYGNIPITGVYLGAVPVIWQPASVTPQAPDTTPPMLYGVENTTVEIGSAFFSMDGVSAVDNVDGDITDRIIVSGEVDTKTTGEYTLTYTVSDTAGNEVSAIRTVTVKDSSAVSLNSLPNGIADEVIDGRIFRRVGVVEYDGSADAGWVVYNQLNGTSNNTFRIPVPEGLTDQSEDAINVDSDNSSVPARTFTEMNADKTTMGLCWKDIFVTSAYQGNVVFRITRSMISPANLTGFLNWLSSNPIKVYYALKSPYFE